MERVSKMQWNIVVSEAPSTHSPAHCLFFLLLLLWYTNSTNPHVFFVSGGEWCVKGWHGGDEDCGDVDNAF